MAPSFNPKLASDFLLQQIDRVAFQINRAARRLDAEAIHDLRVTIRRLIQGLALFKNGLASKIPKKLKKGLRSILTLAGEVRNCDIALEFFSKIRVLHAASLHKNIQAERRRTEQLLNGALKRWAARKMLRRWRQYFDGANLKNTRWKSDSAPRRKLPSMAKAFFEYGDQLAAVGSTIEEFHRFRLAAKKFRYSLEIFRGLYGPEGEAWLDRLKVVQEVLGKINDCSTIQILLSQIGNHQKLDAALYLKGRRGMAEFRRFWAREHLNSPLARQWTERLRHPAVFRRPPREAASRALPAHAASAVMGS